MVGWHHQLSGQEFEQAPQVSDGQGSLVCSSPCSHKELDMAARLNWNEPSPSVPTQFHTILLLTIQLLIMIENQLPLNPEVPKFLNDWHWGSSFSGLFNSSMLFPLLRHWWNSRFPWWSNGLESLCQCRGRVQSLVQEASTWLRATKPMHNYWAQVLHIPKPVCPRAHVLQQEKPLQWVTHAPQPEVASARWTRKKLVHSNKAPAQPTINK